jgi:hypothetical protein
MLLAKALFLIALVASVWTLHEHQSAQRKLERILIARRAVARSINVWAAIMILMFALWIFGLYAFGLGAMFSAVVFMLHTVISIVSGLYARDCVRQHQPSLFNSAW